MVSTANQLTGFYMRATLTLNGLYIRSSLIYSGMTHLVVTRWSLSYIFQSEKNVGKVEGELIDENRGGNL